MPVIYNGKKIIPAPFCNISKSYQTTDDGQKIGSLYNIELQGTLVAHMGSPDSNGDFWTMGGYPPSGSSYELPGNVPDTERLKSILKKQEAIRTLFANEGQTLEISPLDGSTPTKCNPRVISIQFQEGLWYERCQYTISLETDVLYLGSTVYGEDESTFQIDGEQVFISEASEDWSIEEDETEDVYVLTHTLSARGKSFYDENGNLLRQSWENAKLWVNNRSGFTLNFVSGYQLPGYYGGYNYIRQENIGTANGSYELSETWLIASGEALETFEISTREDNNAGTLSVSVEGEIRGLSDSNRLHEQGSQKYSRAESKWNTVQSELYNRVQSYTGLSGVFNVVPLNKVVGRNPVQGIITYSYEYDNRRPNCISGAISENIIVTENYQSDVIARLGIPGRIKGPILQNINTKTERSRGLSIEIVMSPTGNCDHLANLSTKPNVNDIIEAVKPTATQTYLDSDSESWSWKTGRYTRTVQWTYEEDD